MLGWVVGAGLTAWILWGPVVQFAYHGPSAHLVLRTVDACVALLAAYLAHGRLLRERRVADLLLAQSLIILAVAGTVGPALAGPMPGEPGAADVWLQAALRSAGTVLLLASALAPARWRTRPAARWWTVLGPLLTLTAAGALFWAVGDRLPEAVDTAYLGDHVHPLLLTAHPALIALHLLGAACFLVASVAWTVRARRTDDVLLGWLGPACALGGFARVNYALAPSLYGDWLYTGDVLRSGFYLLLLVGAAREVADHWSSLSVTAVEEDRRRLARELHDGVVQELTYLRTEAHAVDEPGLRERILGATDRALDEARTAVHTLGSVGGQPLPVMLERTGQELARRHGIVVRVDADPDVRVARDQAHPLLRIVREAVTNAARHGRAETVEIELTRDSGARVLRVRDDGRGFDPAAARRDGPGYGLVSMGERARALPGTLEVDSGVGDGSEVRVRW
ncbi:MAG: hypothetical protein DCC50_10805 [Acidobacteria bacterium]|nr:MAG: hypothetical protein DCC50_10805 [Acidobacteriota bacterium]